MRGSFVRPGRAPGFEIQIAPRRAFDLSIRRTVFPAALLALLILWVPASLHAIERRKPQFLTEPSYLIFPLPYSLPGIGEGILLTALAGNIAETNIDLFALVVTGDAEGTILGLEDIHILSETLILDLFSQSITKAVVNNYNSRGMNSDPDDFTLIELSRADTFSARLTLSLFDRRLEFVGGMQKQKAEVPRVRDKDGNIIVELDPPFTNKRETRFAGFSLDYTDDRQDPREGFRLIVARFNSPAPTVDDPEFSVWDYQATFYIPIGKINTLALHYFQSDADVTRQGTTDETAVRNELGFDCSPSDSECLETEQEVVDLLVAHRTNGTSTGLGGDQRLRSYPQGRFSGAHTVFYALEFRWNLSEEVTPFDYFIWKDVRTGVQVAFFAETGSVGETKDEVGETFKSTYGVGLRLVSASGFVYRADLAGGDEGTEAVVIFNYPF